MTFSLALLGTDTFYQTSLSPREYPFGETLSIVSSFLRHTEKRSPLIDDKVEHLCFRNFHLIDGPTITGTEVYDRIKRGLFACLRAVADGQTQINIFAHSRGGAEAILIAHELDRLQALGDALNLTNFAESSIYKLKSQLQKLNWTPEQIDLIKKYIPSLRLSMFILDPVPGDGPFIIRWFEQGFKQLPPIVKHFEEYVYEHERTNYFIPIIPKPNELSDSYYEIHILPGHHGSGSGNPYDQSKGWVAGLPEGFNLEITMELQRLVLIKLVKFLIDHGARFRLSASLPPYSSEVINILRPWQDLVQSMQLYPEMVMSQESLAILDFFHQEGSQTFQHFKMTSYPCLGRSAGESRFIYFHDHEGLVYLKDKFNLIREDSSQFFNQDHIKLFMHSVLQYSNIDDLLINLQKLIDNFGVYISEDETLTRFAGFETFMVKEMGNVLRKYDHSQMQLSIFVGKVKELLALFHQASGVENPRTVFFRGLSDQVWDILNQRLLCLANELQTQAESTLYLYYLKVFHQSINQAYQTTWLPEEIDSKRIKDLLNMLKDRISEAGDNLEQIQDILRSSKEQLLVIHESALQGIIDNITEFEQKLILLGSEDVLRLYHQDNIKQMLNRLEEMNQVLKIAKGFYPIIFKKQRQDFLLLFKNTYHLLFQYFDVHKLDSILIAEASKDHDFWPNLKQDMLFKQFCYRDFRNQLDSFKQLDGQDLNQNLRAIKEQYRFLWEEEISLHVKSELDSKLHQLECYILKQESEAILQRVETIRRDLSGLAQLEKAIQALEQIKRDIPHLSISCIKRQGQTFMQVRSDIELRQWLNDAISNVRIKLDRLHRELKIEVQDVLSSTETIGPDLEGLTHLEHAIDRLNRIHASAPHQLLGDRSFQSSAILAFRQSIEDLILGLQTTHPKLNKNWYSWINYLKQQLDIYQQQTQSADKESILQSLQQGLNGSNSDLSKLSSFFSSLHESKDILRMHQDPRWQQVMKNLAIILPTMILVGSVVTASVVASGLLSVLLASLSLACLAMEALVIHQGRGHLCFWRSRGEDFVQIIEQSEDKLRQHLSQ